MRRKTLSVDEAQSSEKEQISLQFTKKFLFEIDEFSKNFLGGISRAAIFVNSFRIMRLYYEQKLGINSVDSDQLRLNRIESDLENLKSEKLKLQEIIEQEIEKSPDPKINQNPDYRNKILDILKVSKSLSIPALAQFLNVEEAIIFTICSQLKKESRIIMNEGEWSLNDSISK